MLDADRETFMTARYALYYAPDTGSSWWQFGSSWLGRCAATGNLLPQPRFDGVDPAALQTLTAAPRRYGFHATLKPPFGLARGASLAALAQALDRFCARQTALRLALTAAEIDGFLALVPAAQDARLDELAAACVRGLDRFREAPAAAELARRRRNGLSAREDCLLRRWGYPYVMDRFRFHLSLTGSLRDAAPPVAAALRAAAAVAIPAEPLHLDSICIFEEPEAGADLRIVHRAPFGHRGRLIYVMGPSGAGKDSLLEWVRARLPGDSRVRLARRTITRPAHAGGEDHLAATEAQFDAALARGEFALHWRANGHRYGIAREIEQWLAEGRTVVVNGSREYLPVARAKFPQIEAVHVVAPAQVLQSRLSQRGRERPDEAARRLARNAALSGVAPPAALVLENDGPIEAAGARLAAFVAAATPQSISEETS
jgi:phosphonate metabolism protein PhnN/1,5-bisphosphokinase (PRPP-forming)